MEKFLELFGRYRDYILFLILLVIFCSVQAFVFWYFSSSIAEINNSLKEESNVVSAPVVDLKKIYVNIKGEVRSPGVYIMDEGQRVIDVVKKAGGFTKRADASANNLGMKLSDEMVIVIYSKAEIADYVSTKEDESKVLEKCKTDIIVNDACVKEYATGKSSNVEKSEKNNSENVSEKSDGNDDDSTEIKLVSLNDATLEELMTLSGIGESKAKAIIEYRETKKFETIDELKEVSGIGDALFEKIKDNITT